MKPVRNREQQRDGQDDDETRQYADTTVVQRAPARAIPPLVPQPWKGDRGEQQPAHGTSTDRGAAFDAVVVREAGLNEQIRRALRD